MTRAPASRTTNPRSPPPNNNHPLNVVNLFNRMLQDKAEELFHSNLGRVAVKEDFFSLMFDKIKTENPKITNPNTGNKIKLNIMRQTKSKVLFDRFKAGIKEWLDTQEDEITKSCQAEYNRLRAAEDTSGERPTIELRQAEQSSEGTNLQTANAMSGANGRRTMGPLAAPPFPPPVTNPAVAAPWNSCPPSVAAASSFHSPQPFTRSDAFNSMFATVSSASYEIPRDQLKSMMGPLFLGIDSCNSPEDRMQRLNAVDHHLREGIKFREMQRLNLYHALEIVAQYQEKLKQQAQQYKQQVDRMIGEE